MTEKLPRGVATVAQLADFDEVIDARSPAEFAEDHLPRAISCPVLDDDERARIGTLYKQVSPFEARKIGAVLVARNVARHIEAQFLDRPKNWRPLVYCWRGGQRSGAFAHVLREIGWDAHRLNGGYKAWRREVTTTLESLPSGLRFLVLTGATGSAKSRILEALAAAGAQVLHLEQMAAHKGSVLGNLPDERQPSQRMFESRLHASLAILDARRPVYVEAESRRIGILNLPNALIAAIRAAPCVRIDASREARIEFLLRDYKYFLADPQRLTDRLKMLQGLQSNATLLHWQALIGAGQFHTLVNELLEKHYDPHYQRSQDRNYADFSAGSVYAAEDLSPAGITRLTKQILVNDK
jgi:tRNA 2-selenouridine synthase